MRNNMESESNNIRGAEFNHKKTFYCILLDNLFFLDSCTTFISYSFVKIHISYVMGNTAKTLDPSQWFWAKNELKLIT